MSRRARCSHCGADVIVELVWAGEDTCPNCSARLRSSETAAPGRIVPEDRVDEAVRPAGARDWAQTRHLVAVTRTLGRADSAAAGGDFADAIAWLDMVEAIGDGLPFEYEAKRRAWREALNGRVGTAGDGQHHERDRREHGSPSWSGPL